MPQTLTMTVLLSQTGLTLKAAFQDTAGTIDATLRDEAASEVGGGLYSFTSANFPDNTRGRIVFYTGTIGGGSSFSGTTIRAGAGINLKTGYKLASDGLDSIPITAPSGVATTFRGLLVQLHRRFFGKAVNDQNNGTLKTYAADGTTVVTTQALSTSGGVQTQGEAA